MFSFLSWYLRLDGDLSLLGVFHLLGSQNSKSGRVYLQTRDCESESVIARERFLAQMYNRVQLLDPDDAG